MSDEEAGDVQVSPVEDEDATPKEPVPEGWVRMYHPELENSETLATDAAWTEVYAEKGWLREDGVTAGESAVDPETATDEAQAPESVESPENPEESTGRGSKAAKKGKED